MPLASSLLTPSRLLDNEAVYPATLVFCRDCALVQLLETVSPVLLFDDAYSFYAADVDGAEHQAAADAESIIAAFALDKSSLVIDIGSNDGLLLHALQERGVPGLGVEPAPGQAHSARLAGVPTLATFFTYKLGSYLMREEKSADLVLLRDVLQNVNDLHGFLRGVDLILRDEGTVVIEVPYIRDIVQQGAFDAVYHERLTYFSVTSLKLLIELGGLALNHVVRLPARGGTLRLRASRRHEADESVRDFLREEQRGGLTRPDFYRNLGEVATRVGDNLHAILTDLQHRGMCVVGYGAGPEATVLLNTAAIDYRFIEYVVDGSVHRQGRFLPGVHLPVLSPTRLTKEPPNYTLVFDPATRAEMLRTGVAPSAGRSILPLPDPRIL